MEIIGRPLAAVALTDRRLLLHVGRLNQKNGDKIVAKSKIMADISF